MTPNMVTATEGYFRWTDVVFEWVKLNNPYQRRALTSLVHQDALSRAEHPLAAPGRPLQVYLCELKGDGCRLVCFSLAQLEYLQHYVHAMGIADPTHPRHIEHPPEQPFEGPFETHIPLPSGFIPSEAFKQITPINYSKDVIKTLLKETKKHNNAVRRELSQAHVYTPSSDAPGDLLTPAPSPAAPSLPTPAVSPAPPSPAATAVTPPKPSSLPSPPEVLDDVPNTPSEGSIPSPEVDNATSQYFNRALAAVKFAYAGGMAERLRATLKNDKDFEAAAVVDNLGAGRSLFISLAARIHPYTHDLVDFGYHALWFQADDEIPGQYVRQEMYESWICKEEIGYAGEPTEYLHGKSKTYPRDAMPLNFQQMMEDLISRAGGGPIFIIAHSADDLRGLSHLMGRDNKVSSEFFIAEPPYDAYADVLACRSMFMMDTTRLFAAVEQQQPGDTSVKGVTGRSVTDIMTILYGPSPREEKSDNAGNTAVYTMNIFKRLMLDDKCPTLDLLRAKFAPKLDTPVEAKDSAQPEDDSDESDFVEFVLPESEEEDDDDFAGVSVFVENADGDLVAYNPDDDDE